MDRNRENRRGGGTLSGHGSSSRRRPRSTFKDSSVGEEDEVLNESHDSARLRERSNSNNNKKERSSLTLSSSRNKRKRPGLQERFHGNRDNDGGRGDESSEDSGADDDDDDDDEPPRPPNPSRRTAKFKSQWKVSEEMIGVGLVSVPRKARSASVKRGHDSSTVSVGAPSASDGHAHRQSSPSPARPSGISVSPSSSNVSAKPGRRMKPIGTKPRASKMAKVSNSISEREVEVAEVLFGLTRQFHTQHSASESFTTKPDVKESSNDASVPVLVKVSSPIAASSVVSSPVSAPISPPSSSPALTLPQHSTPTPAVAPKRKRPRPAKPEETTPAITMRPPATLGSISVTTSTTANVSGTKNEVEQASQATKMEVSSSRVESNVIFTGGLIKGVPSVASTTTASSICMNSNPVPTSSAISIQREIPIIGEKIAGAKTVDSKPITSEKMGAKIADSKPALPAEKKPSAVSEELDKAASEVSETPVDQIVTKEIDAPTNDLSTACPDVKAEDGKMSPLPKTENTSEEKFKIDLMAPPAKSSHDTDNDSGPGAAGNSASELAKKEIVEITNVSEVKEVAVKMEREHEKTEEEVKEEEAEKKYDKTDNGEEKGIQKQHVKDRTVELQLEEDNLEKDSSKQQVQKQGRISRGELRAQKSERPVSAAVAPGNSGSSPSAVASLPIPITVAGWPGGLPPLGYFGPVAANWPGAPSLQVVSMEGNNTTPTLQPAYIMQQSRQSWKRCAIHSYIAHFIDCQQKMASHPFWAAANYGCYGSKTYNLNMPLPPPSESINLGGSLPGRVSSSGVGNSGSVSRNLGSLQDRIIGSAALAAFGNQNPKEKAATSYMDSRRKQSSHQQTTQQTTSQNMQHGPAAFGFPITQSGFGGATLSTAGNIGNAAASLNSGNSALGAASSAGTGAANTGAEAQYLTMLQQSGYSLAIPQAHFGATYNAGQQQGAQFFNGSFYAPQLLHPPPPQPQMQPHQQGPQNPSTSSGSSSSQKHQQQLQGSRNFPSSQKQQQQQVTPTPSPSNSQQQHHLPASQTRQIEREASNGADSPSTADSRLPMIQKGFFSQASSSNSSFNVNPPSLLAAGMPVHPQDLAFMAALGGKHNGKQQQQQQQQQHQPSSEIGHLQQQGGAGFAIQQHHGNGQTIQMSFKGVELSSQALAAMSMSRISGPLGFPSIAQGHTALQGIPEPTRHPHQSAAQAQQIVLQSGQQSQRSGQMQRTQLTSTDEGRNSTDSISNASGRGREDDRKMPVKGGLTQSLNFSRIDAENSTNMHGSPQDGGLSTSSLLTNSVDSMGRTLNLIAPPGNGNHNTRSPQPPTQQLNQNMKQSMGRVKSATNPNVLPPVVSAQANLTNYGDRMSVSSNLNKFQASTSSFPGQNQKQVQQSPQWKMGQRTTIPSNMSSTVGAPSQAVLAAPLTSYPQQGRNQQGSSNLGATAGAPPQAAFASSTKSSGQPPLQQNNSSSLPGSRLSSTSPVPASVVGSLPISNPPPVSKSAGTPALRAATGSKGPIQQQKSTAPASNKKSSPVGGRSMPSILSSPHMSQSSSGKSSQQQYQLQQTVPPIGSGQPVNLKNQQYHNQAHFNQQQILFPNQYLQQQVVQQSQLSQSTHQTSGFHQKQQMHGSSSPQLSFSNPHLRRQQDQQQQMQPVSSPSSNAGPLSLGSPALTLGGASCVPAKIMPGGSHGANGKGSTVLHVPYNPLNSTGPSQQQSGSPHASLSSQYMQAVTNVSAKSAEQKTASDGLNQDQVNGVRLLQNSINLSTSSVQSRNHFNASSPQGSSIRMPAGSLKKGEGGSTSESLTSPGGLGLSMAPSSGIRTNNGGLISSGNAVQHAKSSSVSSNAVHSGQISPMPMHPPPVSIAAGTLSPATAAPPGLHGQAATSVVQP